jgi:hypothetical protein
MAPNRTCHDTNAHVAEREERNYRRLDKDRQNENDIDEGNATEYRRQEQGNVNYHNDLAPLPDDE